MTKIKVMDRQTGEQITDDMQTAAIMLEATANIVADFDPASFGAWLGSTIDQWAANNHMSSEETVSFFTGMIDIMKMVHKDLGMMEATI